MKLSDETKLVFEGPEEIRALFEVAIYLRAHNEGGILPQLIADKLIAAGLAEKEEYRLWKNDGRGGFLPITYYFPPGSGAALTQAAKNWLLPKPRKPRMGELRPSAASLRA